MRILFLQKRLLFPADTGGKIRTLNVLKHLARWHEVTYLSNLLEVERPYLSEMRALGLRTETVDWRESSRQSLSFLGFALTNLLFSKYPLNVDKDFDKRIADRARSIVDSQAVDLVICDFVQMARNAMELATASVLFQHNVEAEIFARQSDAAAWPISAYLRLQARRMANFESHAGRCFTRVVAVSQRDRDIFESRYHLDNVRTIDTAVDLEYFANQSSTRSPRIVFVGSMDWPPNQQGVLHFGRSIFPRIRGRRPDVQFWIVGRNPPAAIRALAALEGVVVTGTVADTRPTLHEAMVSVVPLYAGGGTRLKIFESMASGIPVVSTKLGAEGLPVHSGEHLLIADADDEFADAVLRCLEDVESAQAMAERGLQWVKSRFGAEAVARQFEAICREAVEVHAASDLTNRR